VNMSIIEYFTSSRFLFVSFILFSFYIYRKMEYPSKQNGLLNGMLVVLFLTEIMSLLGMDFLIIILHLGFVITVSIFSAVYSNARIKTNIVDDIAIIVLCASAIDLVFKIFPYSYINYLRLFLMCFIIIIIAGNLIRNDRFCRSKELNVFNYGILPCMIFYHFVNSVTYFRYSFVFVLPLIYILTAVIGIISVYRRHKYFDELIKSQNDDIALAFGFTEKIRNEIISSGSSGKVLDSILLSSMPAISAEGGAVYLFDDASFLKKVSASGKYISIYEIENFRKEKSENSNAISDSLSQGHAFFSYDNYKDKRHEVRKYSRIESLSVNSIIIMPVKTSDKYYGVFVYQKISHGRNFSELDLRRAETFADFAAIAIANIDFHKEILFKNEIEKEISIAAAIQKKLLPKNFGLFDNCIIEGYTKPARGISGDYFDFFRIGGGKVGFVICDVAGKGVPASLVAVMIRTIIHIIKDKISESATMLDYANLGLTGHVGIDRYATMSSLIIDNNSGRLDYSNAGHHPCILCRSNQENVEEIEAEGFPVGITTEKKYKSISISLNKGDRLIFYTDGVTEAMNKDGVQFSVNRLKTIINTLRHLSPSELVSHIRSEVDKHAATMPQHDDQTVVVIEYLK